MLEGRGGAIPCSWRDIPCNVRREGGQSLVIEGSSLVVLQGKAADFGAVDPRAVHGKRFCLFVVAFTSLSKFREYNSLNVVAFTQRSKFQQYCEYNNSTSIILLSRTSSYIIAMCVFLAVAKWERSSQGLALDYRCLGCDSQCFGCQGGCHVDRRAR